ncbi:MAG: acyl-CoA dehydrogenase N-terminal domain-containing protein [Rhodobacteraceae bacterium]|nr:acyl-CoA dehydrogenase N-terminal domain-containing protein [Paracoccaceae bacterium]
MPYRAPLQDFRFLLDHVIGFDQVSGTGMFAEATAETTQAILTEAARLCEDVMAPLQRNGDLHPARLENGDVGPTPGFCPGVRPHEEGGGRGR